MKSFFASFFGTIAGICVLVGISLLLLVFLFIGIASSDKSDAIPSRSLLVLDLSYGITDAPPQLDPADLIDSMTGGEEKRVTLRDTLRAIASAANDSRISGILISGNSFPIDYASGYAALREVREALMAFKASRKPIYAYLVAPSTRTFYV